MRQTASLILSEKAILEDGRIVQIKVWKLPAPTAERPHGLKYSLFFGGPGLRAIGYDNETGKGDHRHRCDHEEPYVFTTLEKLVEDFMSDVLEELSHERT